MNGTQADGIPPTVHDVVGLIASIDNVETLRTSDIPSYLDALTVDQLASILHITPGSNTNDNNNDSQQSQSQLQQSSETVDPIQILDPCIHSLGYLYFITARCIKATQNDALPLYHLFRQFVDVADMVQVTMARSQMERIIIALEHLAQVLQNPLIPLHPLCTIITRLTQPPSTNENIPNDNSNNGAVLTIFHAAFARHCILTKMYQYSMPILNHDIVQVDPKLHGTTIEHYLEYHYYGAILYIGNKEYEKAVEFLTLVITAPVQKAISAIQLEAYKRYILVSLIAYGHFYALPRYVPVNIEKTCKKQSGAYFALMDAFDTDDIGKLTAAIQKNQQAFEADGLLGLVNQLIQASYRKKIKMMTNIYFKVKLDDLARQVSAGASSSPLSKDQIEHLLVDMIGKNYIKARLSIVMEQGKPVKMIQFDEETTSSAVFGSSQRLEQAVSNIARVNDQVAIMDKCEGLNGDFQSKYMVISTNSQLAAPSGSNMDEDMDVPIDD